MLPNFLKWFCIAAVSILSFQTFSFAHEEKLIAITQFIDHKAANAIRKGLLERLKSQGFVEGKNITIIYENAQGSLAIASQIARHFLSLNPAVIVSITTPSTQPIVKALANTNIPLVFTAVTDPIASGIVKSLAHRKHPITGVSDAPPIKKQIQFIRSILPQIKRIGILYNPGDPGSTASIATFINIAKSHNIEVIEIPVVQTSNIQSAVLRLLGKVDAIYTPLDNIIVSSMETIGRLAIKYKTPLFSGDCESVKAGAFACTGYSYYNAGQITGQLVADILKGKDPKEIPIASPTVNDIFINQDRLEKLGIKLPDHIKKSAKFY